MLCIPNCRSESKVSLRHSAIRPQNGAGLGQQDGLGRANSLGSEKDSPLAILILCITLARMPGDLS
jgi:hypothetical protein